MKKNFLLTMVVMLMTAISSFAQNEQKEYNMVITLNNGTTVTLGHNDIKDITFNNGEISISGDVVSTIDALQQRTDDQRADIDALNQFTAQLHASMESNRIANDEQDKKIQDLAATTVDGFQQLGNVVDAKINNMAEAVDKNFALYGDAISALSAGQEQLSQVNEQLVNSIDMIITYMEKFHPELAGAKEMKVAKEAIAAARKK